MKKIKLVAILLFLGLIAFSSQGCIITLLIVDEALLTAVGLTVAPP